jgi:hypothetical protein
MSDNYTDNKEANTQRPLPRRNRKPYEDYTPEDVKLRLDEARKDLTDPKSPLAKLLSDPDDLEQHLQKVERLLVSSIERAFIKVGKKFDRARFVERVAALQNKGKPSTDSAPAPVEQRDIQPDTVIDKTASVPDKTSKPEEIEKVVVVDKKGELSGVKVDDLTSPPESADKEEEPDDTKSRSLLGRVGKDVFSTAFPTLSRLTKTVRGEKKGESAKDKMKRIGGDIFKTAFPTLAKVIEYVQDENKQKSTEGVREATRSRRALEKTESMGAALQSLATEQRKSVDLLEDLLDAVRGLRNQRRGGRLGRFGGMLGAAGQVLGAAGSAIRAAPALLGAAAYTLSRSQETERSSDADSPLQSRTERSSQEEQPYQQITVPHSAQNGVFKVGINEVDENTYNEFVSLIDQRVENLSQEDQVRHHESVINLLTEIEAGRRAPVRPGTTTDTPPQSNPVSTESSPTEAPALTAPTAPPVDSDAQTRRVDPIHAYIDNRETEALRQYSERIRDRLIQVSEANSQRLAPSDTVNRSVITALNLLREGKLDEASAAAEEANTSLESERIRDRVTQEQAQRLGSPADDRNIAPTNPPAPATPVVPETSAGSVAPATPVVPETQATPTDDNADLVTRTSSSRMLKDSDSATPKSPITNITAEPLAKDAPTPGSSPDLSGLSGMDLILKARTVTFKGDEIEFVGSTSSQVARPSISTLPGLTTPRAAGGVVSPGAGGTIPEPIAPAGGAVQSEGSGSQQLTTEQESAADTSGLTFARGVDPRIKKDIAQKIQQIEGAFGKKLTITSGFRDSHRNAAAGGARNSAHTRANAVDIQFQGNEEDTNRLIEIASAAGIGGIGVYRPGWVHLDIESKRVWGPDFSARSAPEWAKDTLRAHMTGEIQKSPVGDVPDAEPVTASPVSPSMIETASPGGSEGGGQIESSGGASSSPTPEPPIGEMGAAVMGASQENAVAERIPVPPTITAVQSPPQAQPTPGTVVPDGSIKSVNDPGNVEPDDAAERYAKLFNMAA